MHPAVDIDMVDARVQLARTVAVHAALVLPDWSSMAGRSKGLRRPKPKAGAGGGSRCKRSVQ
eukprot:3607837-Alexandrium_andersonii.AAC.1